MVSATTPVAGATGVSVGPAITATFTKVMKASTINTSTFTLTGPGGTAVLGAVTYTATGSVATFMPAGQLTLNTTYLATITTGATDTAATPNALASKYAWTFTTAPAPAPPTIAALVPANGSTGVALSQVVTATFSTAMNASTVNASTFRLLAPGGVAVAGTVSYASTGNIGTFTPALPLSAGTTYIATITTGAQNIAGTGLAATYVSSFTTVPAALPPVPPFVVSTTPASGATGVMLTQVETATFSKPMNAATLSATNFTVSAPGGAAVTGVVSYNAGTQAATFTPTVALIANTTYVATISTGATDASGTQLAANYLWTFTTIPGPIPPIVVSTIPVNTATGVSLSQGLSAVFSKAMNPATLTNATFTVTASGGTSVSGTVSYAAFTSTASFAPAGNLLPSTTYVATITTGAQDTTGTPIAANYIWTFRTVAAPTPPTVISTNPANQASGVPFNQEVSATFSEAMNPATINASTFTLAAPGGVAIPGTVAYVAAGAVATLTPATALTPSTTYVVTIKTGAQDLAGVGLAGNYVWTFTTGAAPDTTKPTVISTVPVNGATGVPFNQAVSVTFSEAMNPASINSTSFALTAGGTPVVGMVTYATIGNTATFTPTGNLAPATLFTASITTGATDLAGNTLADVYTWTFTTGAAPDTTKPFIILSNPASGATGVPVAQAVSATFNEAMDPLSITTATFQLTGPGNAAIVGTVSYDAVNFIATFHPSTVLTAGALYTALVTTGARDLAGNTLGAGGIPNPWNFTTAPLIVILPPVNLGTAVLFGGFGGGAGMTNMGTQTVINGDIGTTGVSTLITGFHDSPTCIYTETPLNIGMVNGTIDTAPPPPTVACPLEGTAVTAAIANQASLDAGVAYAQLAAFPNGLDVSVCPNCGGGSAGELGNRTLAPGIYKSAPGSYSIVNGDLTLDAKGDPNAFWVFQMSTTFTVGSPSAARNVILINGAQARNVFWQVGTAATLNGVLGGGTIVGTVISQAGISVSTAGVAAVTTINGRALSIVGPVTLVNTVINVPAP